MKTNLSKYSPEQLREMAELTETVLKNLAQIEERIADIDPDLDELDRQTDNVVANLQVIEDADTSGFNDLEDQTSAIAANLKAIEECNIDLDELEERTSSVVANLQTITNSQ